MVGIRFIPLLQPAARGGSTCGAVSTQHAGLRDEGILADWKKRKKTSAIWSSCCGRGCKHKRWKCKDLNAAVARGHGAVGWVVGLTPTKTSSEVEN